MTNPVPLTRDVSSPVRTSPRRSMRWIAWAVVLAAAVVVAVLLLQADDPASAPGPPGGKRGGAGAKATPVTMARPTTEEFTAYATYRGELDADTADVAATIGGRLIEVHVRLGDTVEAGAPLATLDDQERKAHREALVAGVAGSRAAVRGANVAYAAAKVERDRAEGLANRGAASEQAADTERARVSTLAAQTRVARAQLATATANLAVADYTLTESVIRAPFSGVVTARLRDPGGFLAVGEPVVRLVRVGDLRVRFEVPEQNAASISTGVSVRVRAAATGDTLAGAVVSGVSGEVDRAKRVVTAEARVTSPPSSWFSGMYAEVVVPRVTLSAATVVPESALVSRLLPNGVVEDGVFEARGDVAHWVPVRIHGREAGIAAISTPGDTPLAADAEVLVSGHGDLSDGAPIVRAAKP